jgi:hypothetical protein
VAGLIRNREICFKRGFDTGLLDRSPRAMRGRSQRRVGPRFTSNVQRAAE